MKDDQSRPRRVVIQSDQAGTATATEPLVASAPEKALERMVSRLQRYRDVHLQWAAHLTHCAGCPDCAKDVVEQVGNIEKHRSDAAFYEEVILMLRALTQ